MDSVHAAPVVRCRYRLVVGGIRVGAAVHGVRARAVGVVVGRLRVLAVGRQLAASRHARIIIEYRLRVVVRGSICGS